jgi:hypothetical protein
MEGRQMQDWHSTCLGRRTLPRDLSAFEIEAFFNFTDAERRVIEDRRGRALKLALALQIGRSRSHLPDATVSCLLDNFSLPLQRAAGCLSVAACI